jgi:hypothetical protein
MLDHRFLSVAIGIALLGVTSTALAAGPKAGKEVRFCGPVIALVEGGCIGVTSGANTYEISSIGPKPAVGSMIVGRGYVGDEVTTCMQGIHLRSAMWKIVEVCPLRY